MTESSQKIVGQGAFPQPDLKLIQTQGKLAQTSKNSQFLRWAFGFSLAMTFACIFCQGFGLWNFRLSEPFLHWLGLVTVGQVAGLFAMVIRQK